MTDSIYSHIANFDGNWGTMEFRKASLALPVTHIHLVAHENQENVGGDGQPPANHWTISLQVGSNSSVRIDMVPGEPGRPGMVVLQNKSYDLTTKRTCAVSAEVTTGTTVASILSLIINKKRDNYVYSPLGEGCRFWVSTVVSDLASEGVILLDKANEAQSALAQYWPYPTGTEPTARAIVPGRFF
ncbi:hypothetical protein OF83DRAFT_1084336 [Amylostereum chailletii]|nr:hypothetical protein OF83DRAFT_1084336 [Amylostereum chailletii]